MSLDEKRLIEKIKMLPTVTLKTADIDFDEDNPNIMTNEQLKALELSVVHYGFAVLLWVTKKENGRYLCIDGNQRGKILKKYEVEDVECKVFDNLTKSDIIILRNIANKLRGQHDPKIDQEQFGFLKDAGKLQNLADMLGQSVENFITPSQEEITLDNNIMADREQSYLAGNIKQIVTYFTNEEYEKVIPDLKDLMTKLGVDNNTDLFTKLIEHAKTCTAILPTVTE